MIEFAEDDQVAVHAEELAWLFDAIQAESEFREGWYSDETHVSELFDIFTAPEAIGAAMDQIGLVGITGRSLLIEALQQIRARSRAN